MEDACAKVLRMLAPGRVLLSYLKLVMDQYNEPFLKCLSQVLSSQKRLVTTSLPSYSANRDVIAALGHLPDLEEYMLEDFSGYQAPVEVGKEFDWPPDGFASLRKLSFIASLVDAGEIMGKEHQSRLRSLEITCRTPHRHSQLRHLSTKLSASIPQLTSISLFLYSEAFVLSITFDSIQPLLLCRALLSLVIGQSAPLVYTQSDIEAMAVAWPAMQKLVLTADPVNGIGHLSGQPLRSVGVFAHHFPYLTFLGIYINTFEIPLEYPKPTRFRVLDVLCIGTSPTTTNHLPVALYLGGVLAPTTVLKSHRSTEHVWALPSPTLLAANELFRRAKFWHSVASDLQTIQASILVAQIQDLVAQNQTLLKEVGRLNNRPEMPASGRT
ncbi:hypothetical protein FRB95_008045 [Tulasnella sp. JGI-2019a]|nr:hypothetical protein FRB95_008045 [Tulasnella sp. JGI-2019a]